MAVSFDLFGTLVTAQRPADPAGAVADALRARGISVPDDWAVAYCEGHVDVPSGAEMALSRHVGAALASRGVDGSDDAVRRAVQAAFDAPVETRPGAVAAVRAAETRGPVGLLSNCSVAGLVRRTLERSSLSPDRFDAVVTSVDCGWRKPDPRAFHAVAEALDAPPTELCHVGDDPETDGGASTVGATPVLTTDRSLDAVAASLADRADTEEG